MPYKDPNKQREAVKKASRKYRKRKKVERKRLEKLKVLNLDAWFMASIQSSPEYKKLSKVEQEKIDQIIIDFTTNVEQRVATLKAEIEVKITQFLEDLRTRKGLKRPMLTVPKNV